MGAIHVEGIEETVLKSIALRAEQNGRSLDDEVRAILEAAARAQDGPFLSPDEAKSRSERFAAIRAMTPKGVEQTDSTDMIREMRDRGYANY